MDNNQFNNNQYNNNQYNYNQYGYGQQDGNYQNQYFNQYPNQPGQTYVANNYYVPQENIASGNANKFFSASLILGIISALLLGVGMFLPMIDFSHFHEDVHIQYNLFKVCKNVGLISSIWIGIPYGIAIGAIGMLILSFVRIPVLKIFPCILVGIMFVFMLADVGNVIDWISGILDKYYGENLIKVDFTEIVKSFMIGIYLMIAGLLTGLVSCFVKIKD